MGYTVYLYGSQPGIFTPVDQPPFESFSDATAWCSVNLTLSDHAAICKDGNIPSTFAVKHTAEDLRLLSPVEMVGYLLARPDDLLAYAPQVWERPAPPPEDIVLPAEGDSVDPELGAADPAAETADVDTQEEKPSRRRRRGDA